MSPPSISLSLSLPRFYLYFQFSQRTSIDILARFLLERTISERILLSSSFLSLSLRPSELAKLRGDQISSIGGDGISRPSAIIPGIEAWLWPMSQADLEASLIRGVRIRVLPGKKKGTTRKERRKNADIYTYALHTAREQRCISIPSIDFRHRWTKKPKLGHRSLLSLSPHREIYLSVSNDISLSRWLQLASELIGEETASSTSEIVASIVS